jgi:hypothetical protein
MEFTPSCRFPLQAGGTEPKHGSPREATYGGGQSQTLTRGWYHQPHTRKSQSQGGHLSYANTRTYRKRSCCKALQARVSLRYNAPPRLVLTFYYGWYGTPELSGKWLHWEGVDAPAQAHRDLHALPRAGRVRLQRPEGHRAALPMGARGGAGRLHLLMVGDWRVRGKAPAAPAGHCAATPPDRVPVLRAGSAARRPAQRAARPAPHPASVRPAPRLPESGRSVPVLFVYGRAMEQLSLAQWAWVLEAIRAEFPPWHVRDWRLAGAQRGARVRRHPHLQPRRRAGRQAAETPSNRRWRHTTARRFRRQASWGASPARPSSLLTTTPRSASLASAPTASAARHTASSGTPCCR